MTAKEQIEALMKLGFTKAKLSKCLGVGWPTIQSWYRGYMNPNKENQERLDNLYNVAHGAMEG